METHFLVGARGSYRLARALPSIQVPATVQAVLAARIDRLAPEEKRLLQSASVIGKDVPFALLQSIAELSEDALKQGLRHLQSAEFLYETRLYPDLEYTFKHALTHEVAYGSLLEDRRRVLHARIVGAMERLYPERLVEQVERLAHHSFRGEVWDKAVTYQRQAGNKAAQRSAHREAAACFEQALTALGRVPESRQTQEHAIDLRFELRTALIPLGEYGRIFDSLQRAEILAKELDDQRRLGRVFVYLTSHFREIGEYDRAIESGQRGLSVAEELGDLALQVPTNHFLGQVHYDQGRYRQGSAFLRRNVESLTGELGHERLGLPYLPAVHSRTWLIRCLAELGHFAEALALGEEGARIAESVNHPFSLTSAYWALGRAHLRKGDFDQAIVALERGFELGRGWNIRILLPSMTSDLGAAYAHSGRVSQAVPLLEQAIDQHTSIRSTAGLSPRMTELARAYLLMGRLDEAAAMVERALELSLTHREQGHHAHATHLLGEIAAQTSPLNLERAESAYRRALSLAEELEMGPLSAHCRLGLGRAYRRAKLPDHALQHLSAASALFGKMDMAFWLDQSEAEIKSLA